MLLCFASHGSSIIYRWYKLTLSDQAQVTLQLTASISDFVYRFFFAWGPGKIFRRGTNRLLAVIISVYFASKIPNSYITKTAAVSLRLAADYCVPVDQGTSNTCFKDVS